MDGTITLTKYNQLNKYRQEDASAIFELVYKLGGCATPGCVNFRLNGHPCCPEHTSSVKLTDSTINIKNSIERLIEVDRGTESLISVYTDIRYNFNKEDK